MKKHVILLILITLLIPCQSTLVLGQKTSDSNLAETFYSKALFAILEKMNADWGKIGDSDYKHVIVEKYFEITDSMPTQKGEYNVEYLDRDGLIRRYKERKEKLRLFVAHPAEIDDKGIHINFTVHYFSSKGNAVTYEVSDSGEAFFRYDCEKGEFVIDKVTLSGI